jgi:cell division protein ZipA
VESTVDIKDFILVGGGLLIAAVVAHGFWIAWRERRQDLRIDIKPDLIPDEVDEIERLRGELPNGGGRVVRQPDPQQDSLDLEPPPLSLEPVDAPPLSDMRPAEPASYEAPEQAAPEEVDAVLFGSDWRQAEDSLLDDLQAADTQRADAALDTTQRTEPVLGGEPSRVAADAGAEAAPIVTDSRKAPDAGATRTAEAERAKVADVAMPDPIVADEPKRPRRLGSRKAADWGSSRRASTSASREESREASSAAVPVEELIVMNVLAEPERPFTGDELFATLRTCGLKFGDMNIFHRVEPLTKAVQYSVASAVEPGTFDMAEMEAIRCPGLCLFMQLPGPEDPTAAFEDMLSVAKSVVKSLGGEVKDEHRNIMTPQTVEHYRQRILDFSRRRMSKRA